MIRRLMDNPIPVPCGLVVKNASKIRSLFRLLQAKLIAREREATADVLILRAELLCGWQRAYAS